MSYFSGKVLLGDLDDFIAPAQACSTGLFSDSGSSTHRGAQLVMEDDLGESFSKASVIRSSAAKIATVTLEDCLACSGCVTSAETILIQQQSTSTFVEELKERKHKLYIVIVSRPSCVSIADALSISPDEAYQHITSVLKIGVDIVVRQDIGECISLVESIAEYTKRKASSAAVASVLTQPSYAVNQDLSMLLHSILLIHSYPKNNQLVTSIDLDHITESTDDYDVLSSQAYHALPETSPHIGANAPLITSNCPGWVCYAEKKVHTLVPFLSSVRSAPQVTAALLRRLLPAHVVPALANGDIFIACVASCYDRKLEASRRDFLDADGTRHVNCVLSSQELFDLIQNPPDFRHASSVVWNEAWWSALEAPLLTDFDAALFSSGGVLEGVVASVVASRPSANVEWVRTRTVRNSDFVEVTVVDGEERVFSGAFVYGFRNIQNLVMKTKVGKCAYDVVEVMACPRWASDGAVKRSGCLNGGGQIKPEKREDMML
uniref:Cytosolic Fe-S cluster assembly factor n=1 Tax=Blastocystis sp. subtype 1 (strain ATCC 50177 / NandII) TaxID=478820 RepID=V9VK25_BLAHN|nr:cytosolic Fe-S cluster assembly factor [Blastocystis sp. ATCC 50177/Nand II]